MGIQSKKCPISLAGKSDPERANDRSMFYNHFNIHDFSMELPTYRNACPEQDHVSIMWIETWFLNF